MRVFRSLLVLALVGCDATIYPGGSSINTPPPTGPTDPSELACDISLYPNQTLDGIAFDFATNVYPAMNRANDGCISCHTQALGRNFIVTATGIDTLYQAQEGGFFDNKPGTILARLTATDALSHMPNNQLTPGVLNWWPKADLISVARVACEVQAYTAQGGRPIDELFPPNLMDPYTGPPNTDYDNSNINFNQLKAKTAAIFQDDWIRDGGTDEFEVNLAAFGGVDFVTNFDEAQTITSDFLQGMDVLAPDVCGAAAAAKTGPFTGMNLTQALTDIASSATVTIEAEVDAGMVRSGNNGETSGFGNFSGSTAFFCYTNCSLASTVTLPSQGPYTFNVTAKAQDSNGGPAVEVRLDGTLLGTLTFTDATQYVTQSLNATVAAGGKHAISWAFVNDANDPDAGTDRNIYFDKFQVIGPTGGGGTENVTAARGQLNTLYQKILYRDATSSELDDAYSLLTDLSAIVATEPVAWSGVCEALLRHPDFLFTVPPSVDTTPAGPARDKLLLVKLGLDLLGRPPAASEFAALAGGQTFAQMVDAFTASPDFKTYYFNRMRLRTESQGTDIGDEPARLWTYLAVNDKPFFDLFVADYMIDTNWAVASRPPEHGKSGILTMAGYIQGKQGLPHFNYSARVFTDFMGRVFEVPPEVFAMRANATAASTVDPTSICFNCHQVLTPIAEQRSRWDDSGNYQTVDELGQPIDDTDHNLVPSYPFKGEGMQAFATQAVKKEAFVLSILQSQFKLMLGRNMRAQDDERDQFKALWDESLATNGNQKQILKTIALSKAYQRTTP